MNQSTLLCWALAAATTTWFSLAPQALATDWENVHTANYVDIEDLPTVKQLGVNVVLMELEKAGNDWRDKYQAVVENNLKVIPILWGKNQSIWKWNRSASEWELDPSKYKHAGAKFINFLKQNDLFREHTFAIYSFHEPWYIPDTGKRKGCVEPERQRKFWEQIKQLFDAQVKVYGEEVTWTPQCKNGCVDYDYVTLYSFAKDSSGKSIYRPGGRHLVGKTGIDGSQAPPQPGREQAIKQEREQIARMHQAIQDAPAAPDGTRTKLIALMGTFAHDEERDLWNRMPSASEMRQWARDIVLPEKPRLAGMGWYCFRNPTDYYKSVLYNSRQDQKNEDRWNAIAEITQMVFE